MASHDRPQVSRITIDFLPNGSVFDDEPEVDPEDYSTPPPAYIRMDSPLSFQIGDLVVFMYRTDNGLVRTRLGEVLEIDRQGRTILIQDHLKGEPRRSKFEGMTDLYLNLSR